MTVNDWQALWLTFKLALLTSLILLVIGTPIAWWLARWRHPLRPWLQAIIALPLVLPPTVLGFYLLVAFAPQHWIGGGWLRLTGQPLAFSFSGLVVGSVLYSFPFMVQPLYGAFSQLNRRWLDVAHTMGLSPWQQFYRVVLPLCRASFVSAFVLCFAHTVGEFGVVLMIGGNIPGQTQVLSISLFEHVETLQYGAAHQLAAGLLVGSLVVLALLYRYNARREVLWN